MSPKNNPLHRPIVRQVPLPSLITTARLGSAGRAFVTPFACTSSS